MSDGIRNVTDADLDQVDTERLIQALMRRYPTTVFLWLEDRGDASKEVAYARWAGGHARAVGLLRMGEDFIVRAARGGA